MYKKTFYALLCCVSVVSAILVLLVDDFEFESSIRFMVASFFSHRGFLYLKGTSFLPFGIAIQSFFVLVGYGRLLMRLLSALSNICLSFLIYRFGREFHRDRTEHVAMLVLFNPLIFLYSLFGTIDVFFTLLVFSLAYTYCFRRYLFASLIFFVSILTHYTAWVLVPVFLLDTLISKTDTRKKIIVVATGICGILLWGIVNYFFCGSPINFIRQMRNTVSEVTWNFAPNFVIAFLYPLIYPFMFSAFFFFSMIDVIFKYFREDKFVRFTALFFLVDVICLVLGVLTNSIIPWARYLMPLLPFCIILGFFNLKNSRLKKVIVLSYFLISTIGTCIQAFWIISFRDLMVNV